jgi:hypothetical protein
VGGIVTAINVTEASHERLVVDVACSASDEAHAQEEAPPGARASSSRLRRTSL